MDFSSLANVGLHKINAYKPGKPVDEVQRELGLEKIVKLASNENPLGPSPKVSVAIADACNNLTRYPDGSGYALKQILAQAHACDVNMLTLGNGSNNLLDLIARTFLNPETSAVFSRHAFVVYSLITHAQGAEPIIADADANYGHDLEAIALAIRDDTRVVFLANPNNPTGGYFSHADIQAFLASIPDNIIVVLDEAYAEYVTAADYPNSAKLRAQFDNLIVTRTFSKAYGLASLRVGYSLAHPQITELLNRVRSPFNVNSLALVAACAALGDQDFLQQSRQLNAVGLLQVEKGLSALGLETIPSVANFITFRVPQGFAAGDVNQALLRSGIIVRAVEEYELAGFLRVSIGTDAENALFLQTLASVLGKNDSALAAGSM